MISKHYIFGRKYGVGYSTNLVAYYNLDSNADDSTPNSHNGSSSNVSFANGGKNGTCGTFNGSNSAISIPSHSDFNFSNISNDLPFTISFWVNFNTINGYPDYVLNKAGEYKIFYAYGFLWFAISDGTNELWIREHGSITTGVFENWVMTYNGSGSHLGMDIFKNGYNIGAAKVPNASYTKMPLGSSNLIIGRPSYTSGMSIDAKMDELAIWKNRILNPTEILDLYNTGTGKFYPL